MSNSTPPDYMSLLPSSTPVPGPSSSSNDNSSHHLQAPAVNIPSLLYHVFVFLPYFFLAFGIPSYYSFTTSLALLGFYTIGLVGLHAHAVHFVYSPTSKLQLLGGNWRLANYHGSLILVSFLVIWGRRMEQEKNEFEGMFIGGLIALLVGLIILGIMNICELIAHL